MDWKTYLAGIAVAILLAEILLGLLPEGNMKPYVKVMIGMLLLLLLVQPLQKWNGSFSFSFPKESQDVPDAEKNYAEIILDVYNQELKNTNE